MSAEEATELRAWLDARGVPVALPQHRARRARALLDAWAHEVIPGFAPRDSRWTEVTLAKAWRFWLRHPDHTPQEAGHLARGIRRPPRAASVRGAITRVMAAAEAQPPRMRELAAAATAIVKVALAFGQWPAHKAPSASTLAALDAEHGFPSQRRAWIALPWQRATLAALGPEARARWDVWSVDSWVAMTLEALIDTTPTHEWDEHNVCARCGQSRSGLGRDPRKPCRRRPARERAVLVIEQVSGVPEGTLRAATKPKASSRH